MGMVLELCERAVVLDRGKVSFDGPTAKAVAVYEETAVRARYGGTALAPAVGAGPTTTDRRGGAVEALPPSIVLASNVDQSALRNEPGSIHSTKVRLLFARFLDAAFVEKLLFRTGEDILISIGFRVLEPLAEPHVGFKIRDRLGRIIFETSSLCMRQAPAAVYAGEVITGNFRFRLPLCEGEYSLVVGFAEGSVGDRDYHETLFYVQNVKSFTVVPDPGDIVWLGICHLRPVFGWSVLKDPSET
jgi:lipopolysaccharide transport system ATP-binding protein